MTLQIEQRKISDIKGYEKNAKIHVAEQVGKIAKSISEFGFNDPIAVDENGTIIEGHGRVQAAIQLGLEEVPTIVLRGLSETQKKEYSLVHNKLTMNTPFDRFVLDEELKEIELVDMEGYGFDLELPSYFDENMESEERVHEYIVIKEPRSEAEKIRSFLSKNGFKFREKLC